VFTGGPFEGWFYDSSQGAWVIILYKYIAVKRIVVDVPFPFIDVPEKSFDHPWSCGISKRFASPWEIFYPVGHDLTPTSIFRS
jgi:hypothetical protein